MKHTRKILNFFIAKIEALAKRPHALDVLYYSYQKANNFYFVQVGANDGVNFDYLYELAKKYPCSGIVIEPIKLYFDKLVENYKKYPSIIPLNVALHRTNSEERIFYVHPNKLKNYPIWAAGLGSFNLLHFENHGISKEDVVSECVKCTTFEQLVISNNLKNIDYLQIDTEGYDAEIIKMIDFKLITIGILRYESFHLKKREKIELLKRLKENGYSVFSGSMDTFAIETNILNNFFEQRQDDAKYRFTNAFFNKLGRQSIRTD